MGAEEMGIKEVLSPLIIEDLSEKHTILQTYCLSIHKISSNALWM
jgi:hypothetical protein